MKVTKRTLIKSGLLELLQRLSYNGEITDYMFTMLKKEGGPFFSFEMRRHIFFTENKIFFSLPNPHEIKMFYSSRWNQLKFRISVGYRTWIYRRATELLPSLPEKRMEELKKEQNRFEKNRKKLEEYLKEDVDDPLKKEAEFLEAVLKKKGGEEKILILKQTLNDIYNY